MFYYVWDTTSLPQYLQKIISCHRITDRDSSRGLYFEWLSYCTRISNKSINCQNRTPKQLIVGELVDIFG